MTDFTIKNSIINPDPVILKNLAIKIPQLPDVEVGSIAVFALVNGSTIIGEVASLSNSYIMLTKPYMLMIMPQSGGRVQVGMAPYGADSFLPHVDVRAFLLSHIVQGGPSQSNMEKQYRASRSGLQV